MSKNKKNVRLKIAQASCNQTGGDWPRNVGNICRAIDMAADDGADILSLEELTLTGYERGDDFFYSDNDKTLELLRVIAAHAASIDPNLVISIGHPWYFADKNLKGQRNNPLFNRLDLPFNVQSLIAGGKIVSMSAKRYLYNEERGYEKRHFAEWSDDAGRAGAIMISVPGQGRVPFGSPVVRVGDLNIHHIICEEYWVGSKYDGGSDKDYARDNPLAQKARNFDISVALCPNASPPAANKIQQHHELCRLASKHCGVFVHTDGLGSSGSTFAQNGTRLMAQNGKIISEGQRLSMKDVAYTSQIVSVALPSSKSAKPHAVVAHTFKDAHEKPVQDGPAPWEKGPRREMEEELRNEILWLFDYMRKNKIQGIAQALSGGADSAYNAAKVRLMVELGVAELGVAGFMKAMGHLSYKDKVLAARRGEDAVKIIMDNMLTCVYMGTKNSSDKTLRAAKALAKDIGGKFYYRDMQKLLNESMRAYKGDVEGLTYENVQARLRQVMIMLFANAESKIAIANPNLDEGRNSYATWGGDLHGGMISGNAHKDKVRELEHMRLLHKHGLHGIAPVKGFALILKNKPSAELQPLKNGKVAQFDEDQLGRSFEQMRVISRYMLYDRTGVRKNNAVEVFEKCRKHPAFKKDDIETLHDRIRLSYEKWGHAQFKIHGSPVAATYGENVDHQSSLRTPNTSANHAPEQAQMTLYCLDKMARRDRTSLKKLLGGTLAELSSRALVDAGFNAGLAERMRVGGKTKISALYKKLIAAL